MRILTRWSGRLSLSSLEEEEEEGRGEEGGMKFEEYSKGMRGENSSLGRKRIATYSSFLKRGSQYCVGPERAREREAGRCQYTDPQ